METIIYTSPSCGWCHKLKEFLDQNKIKYTEKDVSDQENAKEMIDKSKQTGTPTTIIDNQIIVGFDEEKLKEALKI